jgi:hypothetical protein
MLRGNCSKFTCEEVSSIAQKLLDEDKNPSSITIRELLGTVNLSTITNLLKLWRQTEPKHIFPPVEELTTETVNILNVIFSEVESKHKNYQDEL